MFNLITSTPLEDKILAIVSPIIQDLNFEIIKISYMEREPTVLQIMIERPDGHIEVSECAKVSTALSTILDIEDPIQKNYTLEVSSPGINRPLTRKKDLNTWQGYNIKLKTSELIDGRKRFSGSLQGLEGNEILLQISEGTIGIDLDWLIDVQLCLTNDQIFKNATISKNINEMEYDEIKTDLQETQG